MEKQQVNQNAPYVLDLEAGQHLWCACGKSETDPICDLKTHKTLGFAPKRFELTEKKKVTLCGCKQTGNPPFCDGTHTKL